MTDPIEERILFIDLETTGLDANTEVPLEICVSLADKFGQPTGDGYTSTIWEMDSDFQKPIKNLLDNEIEPVYSMHRVSGLWQALFDEGSLHDTRREAEANIVELLAHAKVGPKTLPIAGLSIGSLDRPFLQRHFPALNSFLSHRNIDISSIRQIAERLNPDLQKKIETGLENEYEVTVTHRADDDTEYAMALYRAYITNFFVTGAV